MRLPSLTTHLLRKLPRLAAAAACAVLCTAPCLAAPETADPLGQLLSVDRKERGLAVPADNQTHPFGLRVLAKARRQIGTPYHLGTSQPGVGFDCSGLVWWVYQQHGVNIPRISTQQAKIGSPVSLANAQAGDIIVFRTGRGPTGFHTGIVVDSEHFVHAPRTGKRVQEVTLNNWWRTRLYTIRRVRGLRLPEHRMPSADEISVALEKIYASEFSLKSPAESDPLFSLISAPDVPESIPPSAIPSAPRVHATLPPQHAPDAGKPSRAAAVHPVPQPHAPTPPKGKPGAARPHPQAHASAPPKGKPVATRLHPQAHASAAPKGKAGAASRRQGAEPARGAPSRTTRTAARKQAQAAKPVKTSPKAVKTAAKKRR